MRTPAVSIVVPIYNGAEFLGETLDSLLGQTFRDFELLLVDDGSTDQSREITDALRDPRVRLLAQPMNLGLPSALNLAIGHARGHYLARSDQDDVSEPQRIEKQVSFMESRQDIQVCGTGLKVIGLGDTLHLLPEFDPEIKARMVQANGFLANPTSMVRTEFVQQHRLKFDPNLFGADDYGFWVDCVLLGARFHNLQEPLLQYRVHASNQSKHDPARLHRSAQRVRKRLMRAYFPALSSLEIEAIAQIFDLWYSPALETLEDSLRALVHAGKTQDGRCGQDAELAIRLLNDFGLAMARAYRSQDLLTHAHAQRMLARSPDLQAFLA